MARRHDTAKGDLLHPLTKLHWEKCHTKTYECTSCVALHNRVAILEHFYPYDVLHTSSFDLHTWTTFKLPNMFMSITTYKSQFVAVGGWDPFIGEVIDLVFTSDTGEKWKRTLPHMRTKRSNASSLGTTSPEVLVVSGGKGSDFNKLYDIEVLIDNNWHSVPLERHIVMTSVLHQDEILFKDKICFTILSCSIASLISFCTSKPTHTPQWRIIEGLDARNTIISYSTRLLEINEFGIVRYYNNMTRSHVTVVEEGYTTHSKHSLASTLPTGGIVVARDDGIYKLKVSASPFDPDTMFISNVLSRLEVVMGIHIVSVLANSHSQLTTSSRLKPQIGHNRQRREIALPDPQKKPVLYAEEVIMQWCEGHSHHPPTWKNLLDVLEDIGLTELSQQIEAFMYGCDVYVDAYRHFISTKDILEMLFLKFLFLGGPRQGKTTSRRRLLGEIDNLESVGESDKPQASTGTVESGHDMIVQGLTDITAVITGRDWSAVDSLTDEARMLFHNFVDSVQSQTTPVQTSPPAPAQSSPTKSVGETTTSTHPSTANRRLLIEEPEPGLMQKFVSKCIAIKQNLQTALNSKDTPEITALFKEVNGNSKLWKDKKHSFRAYLRMVDTGGQPALMDMLPALTIGPGLYLLFFSYEFQLDEEYPVFYERASGEKTTPEPSAFTLKEMLLCTLSSISCSNASNTLQQPKQKKSSNMNKILDSSKSVVYIVGTHKDKVSEEYISKMDEQLQKMIEQTDFYRQGIVHFYSDEKLVVSLDNMKGGVEEVHQLRQLLEKAMEDHFKKLKIPAVWLLFSLCLRKRKVRTTNLKTCLELSKTLNMTTYETKVALWFLHHHAGVMMYFPKVSGLEDLVIIDIQVVYDSITSVILQAMNFENVGKAKADRFKKTGQFTLADLTSATAHISEDIIPPQKLLALLEYLHIIAQILSDDKSNKKNVKGESEYIMPCVLEYTTSKELDVFHKEACKSFPVFPLCVYFTCGFTPMGLFPALIACLISNTSFTLIREGLKKNMVQFLFESKLRVTFISRPKYYEVIASCQNMSKTVLHIKCAALKSAIETTLQEASSRMNYSSYKDYQFGFECSLHEGEGHLGVVDGAESVPENMTCLSNPHNPQLVCLQNRHLIWYGKDNQEAAMCEGSKSGHPFSVFMSVYPDLVLSVTPCVLTVADHCVSRGLISGDTYDQIVKRGDWIDTDKARCLLNNVRTVLSATPQDLEEFIFVLFQVEDCKFIAEKIRQQLQ